MQALVLEAVHRNGLALRHAAASLRGDRHMADTAVETYHTGGFNVVSGGFEHVVLFWWLAV